MEWQDSSGGTSVSISSAGIFSAQAVRLNNAGLNSFGGAAVSNQVLTVHANSTAYVPLVARGASGQSADLLQIQNSGGTILASVNSSGGLSVATLVSTAGTIRANAGLGSSAVALSSLVSNVAGGHLVLQNITVTPNTPSGAGVLYVEAGALKYRGSSGTITTLGAA
jgi:hypothetical protein